MPKNKLHTKIVPIRISERCYRAWKYLRAHKVNAVHFMREGGEMAVINKANEFYFQDKRNKEFPNAPDWLFQ